MLVAYSEASWDLCDTHSILFGAALAVYRIIGAKVFTAGRATGQSSAIPAWRRRIEERIAKASSHLICFRYASDQAITGQELAHRQDGVCWDKYQFVPAGYNAKTDGAHK
ncbi:unnamed protein product [Parnassius apollo]|uniref:(apollo) hypothetical protein n=1 Tax=Parnassius apollo TaxID=110799 RepID=A0A8S3XFW5_PARAO|nr:unnamed protein product [Parnassius apollo]